MRTEKLLIVAPCAFMTEGRRFVNLNGSHGHPHAYNAHMNEWLSRALIAAKNAKVQPVAPPVVITAFVHRTTNAHSDAHNVTPTIKACIDAAVKCGVIPDDNDGIVAALVIKRGANHVVPAITIRIESVRQTKDVA